MRILSLQGVSKPAPPRFTNIGKTTLTVVMPPALYGGQYLKLYRIEGSRYVLVMTNLQPNQLVPVYNLQPGTTYKFAVEAYHNGPPPASWVSDDVRVTTYTVSGSYQPGGGDFTSVLSYPTTTTNAQTDNNQLQVPGEEGWFSKTTGCLSTLVSTRSLGEGCLVPVAIAGVAILWLGMTFLGGKRRR